MKATITKLNKNRGNYSAKTENNILLVFSVPGKEELSLNDQIEIDLPNLLNTKTIEKLGTNESIKINIMENDIHDLDLLIQHGSSRFPSKERLSEKKR